MCNGEQCYEVQVSANGVGELTQGTLKEAPGSLNNFPLRIKITNDG